MNVMDQSEIIHPVPAMNMVDTQEVQMVVELPPVLKKRAGRPRKGRKSKASNASAGSASSSARRSSFVMRRCSICNIYGHNKRTCELASIARPSIRKSARINTDVGVNAEEPANEGALNEPAITSSSINNMESPYAAFYSSNI
ncbi:hypothetical protein TanjilG_16729 [Lupinus angustifolius]|uniref:Uncharacterized protein n=1 Tax=Lupinus angustifolius TaxID=3871 RepID=A0A4P1QZR5_LUPAN|nr:PREDICTED: uncharacterized protein LOC109326531 [Lupinus angustifolius]OIV98402.1 hypothetical protein TanjilG_16729 [Lupinus angustifolius]